MAQQLYSQHTYNGSMFGSSIYGSSGGGLPYDSGAAAAVVLPPITPPHHSQQQAPSHPQYEQLQHYHLGLADSRGWSLAYSTPLDVPFGLKRTVEEDSLSVSFLSKRARVENLICQRIEPVASSIPLYPQRPGEKFCTFYMSTSMCKFGGSCKFDHPAWVPAGGIPNWKENTSSKPEKPADAATYPERPGEPDCAFYIKTRLCKYGSKCRFNHPKERPPRNPSEGAQDDEKNAETNSAPLGAASLKFPAVKEKYDTTAPLNSKGLPLRPGQTDCTLYIKTGSCKYGDSCRLNHPENSAGLQPVMAAVPQMSVPHSSLLTSIGVGSHARMANDFGLAGGSYNLPLSEHPYPLRPGAPECTFYMKNGECKFGPSCKFNHPLNIFDPIYAKGVKLTAGGLPRREGEPPCPYYLRTGGCNFQTSCKFDHPPPGEFSANALAEPAKKDTILEVSL